MLNYSPKKSHQGSLDFGLIEDKRIHKRVYMGKYNLYLILIELINKQNSGACFTFHEVVKILMENTGYDNIGDFTAYLESENTISNGNPYFKETVEHLYKKTKF